MLFLPTSYVKFYEYPWFKRYGIICTYTNFYQFKQVLLHTSIHTESYWLLLLQELYSKNSTSQAWKLVDKITKSAKYGVMVDGAFSAEHVPSEKHMYM